jgi:hypothetical protein
MGQWVAGKSGRIEVPFIGSGQGAGRESIAGEVEFNSIGFEMAKGWEGRWGSTGLVRERRGGVTRQRVVQRQRPGTVARGRWGMTPG